MKNQAEQRVDLPPRPFLYTLDQIATLLELELNYFQINYVYYEGRSTGRQLRIHLLARNIADPRDGNKPDWRVAEKELVRWMKVKKFRYIERGYVQK